MRNHIIRNESCKDEEKLTDPCGNSIMILIFVREETEMKWTHTAKRGLCWLYAALMTAALMAFALLATEVLYAVNDDAGIMRAFLGYETGTPVSFQLYIHGLLAWPLYWLSCAFPNLPWFTYLQMALLALALCVIAKSIMQCFVKHHKPLWMGAVLAAAVLLTLGLKHVSRLTFTQTSALLGMAAVLQMFSVDHSRGSVRVVLGMAGALGLLALGYAMREESLLPYLAFCGLAFVMLFVEHYGFGKQAKRSMKPMVISLVLVAVVVLGLVGMRQLEYQREDIRDYLAWHNARSGLTDFYDLRAITPEALELVGWDEATLSMLKGWCYLDSEITTESLLTLTEYLQAHDTRTLSDRISQAWTLLQMIPPVEPTAIRCLLILAVVALFALIGAVCRRGRNGRLILAILITLLAAAAMVFYLALQGRLMMRVILVATLPAGAILLALLPACLPKRLNAVLAACVVLCAGYTAWCMTDVLPDILPDPEKELELGSAMGDLEDFALWDEEYLILYDDTLEGADLRAFPDYSEGMPHNIACWGGWDLRSPQSIEQFERFGFDLMNLQPEDLLSENIYIASGRVDPPPRPLTAWVKERLGDHVECELAAENGFVYFFQFYEY